MEDGISKPAVDVKQVANQRELHFNSLEEILREAGRLVRNSPQVLPLGNLSLGQALKHLALTMHASLDGFGFEVPPEVQAYGKTNKTTIINGRMRPGTKLPPAGEARFIPAACTPQEGLVELQQAVSRLAVSQPTAVHPFLGELDGQEWISLHCRHAELHLGFMLG